MYILTFLSWIIQPGTFNSTCWVILEAIWLSADFFKRTISSIRIQRQSYCPLTGFAWVKHRLSCCPQANLGNPPFFRQTEAISMPVVKQTLSFFKQRQSFCPQSKRGNPPALSQTEAILLSTYRIYLSQTEAILLSSIDSNRGKPPVLIHTGAILLFSVKQRQSSSPPTGFD